MKEIPAVVLITGEEEYLVDQELVNLIEQITDQGQYEFEIIRLDGEEVDPQELEQQLKTVTLFSSAQIVTVKNPPWMGNPRGKKGKSVKDFEKVIISFLEHPNEGIYLIITCREATASNPVASAIKKKGEIREIK
ncbi:MAG: DNA polymerase III subunit delta, partial [Chitinophagales bacterium]